MKPKENKTYLCYTPDLCEEQYFVAVFTNGKFHSSAVGAIDEYVEMYLPLDEEGRPMKRTYITYNKL